MEAALALTPRAEPTIGQRLLAILAARNWSLARLAEASGVSVSQLSLLTRGRIKYPRVSTIQAICSALGVAEPFLIGSYSQASRLQPDLMASAGVTTVPVVWLSVDGKRVETGETCAIAATQLVGRRRLFVALVDGGGMAPHVLIGDRVLFDPDEPPAHEQLVLLQYAAATLAAWRVIHGQHQRYSLSDGSWLEPEQVQVAGTIIYIMRSPPVYHAP